MMRIIAFEFLYWGCASISACPKPHEIIYSSMLGLSFGDGLMPASRFYVGDEAFDNAVSRLPVDIEPALSHLRLRLKLKPLNNA